MYKSNVNMDYDYLDFMFHRQKHRQTPAFNLLPPL